MNEAPKTMKDLFMSFCLSGEYMHSNRLALHNPYRMGGKVVATDAYSLIFVDEADCDFEFVNNFEDKAPDFRKILPEPNVSIPIQIELSDFDKYFTEDTYEWVGEDVLCDVCDGGREVEWEFNCDKGSWKEYFDCPNCDGTGYSEHRRKQKTGGKALGNYAVKILNRYYQIDLVYRLAQAKVLLKSDIELIYDGSGTTGRLLLFKVGKAQILMAPMYDGGEHDRDGIWELI